MQVAAYYFDVAIRVFINDGRGQYVLSSVNNPNAQRGTLNLVLHSLHYSLLPAEVPADRFAADSRLASKIRRAPQDGNCFFFCVSKGIKNAPDSVHKIRARVVTRLKSAEQMPLDGNPEIKLGQFANNP